MTIGGVDTYYDYDERQWKFRRLGGGPVRRVRVSAEGPQDPVSALETKDSRPTSTQQITPEAADG